MDIMKSFWVRRLEPLKISDQDNDSQLHQLCVPQGLQAGVITGRINEQRIKRIRLMLLHLESKKGNPAAEDWSYRPRTYAILRTIGGLRFMNDFVQRQLNDFHLPFNEQTLPDFIESTEENDIRQHFLDVQNYYLTTAKDIEARPLTHHSLEGSGDEVFCSMKQLGQGGFG